MDTTPTAVFVDYENVFYSLTNAGRLAREVAAAATMDILRQLRSRLRDDGHVLVVERAYADWEQLPRAQRKLQIAGILPCFTDSRTEKSTADIELSLDILSHTATRPDLRHVVLVGGDRDYLPILRRLKEQRLGIHVCSLRECLSRDVREFVENYPHANVIELDALLDDAKYQRPEPVAARAPVSPTPMIVEPDASSSSHERYLCAMLRFMRERGYRELYLTPFFRWLRDQNCLGAMPTQQQRAVLADLQHVRAVVIEQRTGGSGHPFSVARIDETHQLVQKLLADGPATAPLAA